MRNRISFRILGAAAVAAAILTLPGCGDSAPGGTAEATAQGARSEHAAAGAKPGEPGPPASYTPYRCSKCSCRVFMGAEANCTRPSCKHHWQEHERPAQGS